MRAVTLKRFNIWCFAAFLLFPLSVAAEVDVPYRVKTIFKDAGCRIIRVQKVARTDLDAQSVYVAWCSGSDVYLQVAKCDGFSCHLAH